MDVVYYWNNQLSAWFTATFGGSFDTYKTQTELLAGLALSGRVVRRGNTNIGPPEGPPSNEAIASVMGAA